MLGQAESFRKVTDPFILVALEQLDSDQLVLNHAMLVTNRD